LLDKIETNVDDALKERYLKPMSNASVFDSQVAARLQYSFTKAVLENYREGSRWCFRNFSPPQAKDLVGYYSRAKIEEELPGIVALFPRATISTHRYENNTGHYNEITCGCVKLTQSRIVNRSEVPRHAKFRATLAQNGQQELFEITAKLSEPPYLYAMLTHGVDDNSEKRSWPAFIKIQFPDKSCSRFLDEGIDLLARFPELRAAYIPTADRIQQMKRRRARKQDEVA
jgi:hypothetical protein